MCVTEAELKLNGVANIQFKYGVIDSADTIFKKLKVLCEILNIKVGDYSSKEIDDDYYDDINMVLTKNSIAFRRRNSGTRNLITLKHDISDHVWLDGKLRKEDEFDYSEDDFNILLRDPSFIKNRIQTSFNTSVDICKLIKLVTIHNNRSTCRMQTNTSEYAFSFDKYYYYDPNTCRFSEFYSEIEIELESEIPKTEDNQLLMLKSAFSRLFDYESNKMTKIEKGMDWVKNPTRPITVTTLGFDIVGYSLQNSDEQKEIIQKLNHLTKKSIKSAGIDSDAIYLPTGDGMLLVLEGIQPAVLLVAKELQRMVKAYNGGCTNESLKIFFRTGIHIGQVFKYSDVNGNLSYAGNGINMAVRVMDLGDKWHILLTQDAYNCLNDIKRCELTNFNSLGIANVKHGISFKVYNYFSRDDQFGNPSSHFA